MKKKQKKKLLERYRKLGFIVGCGAQLNLLLGQSLVLS
jgi:hypothetical protein